MNGKIKTKFAALFAVALMITVCVVPVVGNEDVQAASTSNSSGDVFEGYSVKLYTAGMDDYTGLVYNGAFPRELSEDDWKPVGSNYYANKETGKYLKAEDIPGYVPDPVIYGFPMIQFVYGYDGAEINPIGLEFQVKVGTTVMEINGKDNSITGTQINDGKKSEGLITAALGSDVKDHDYAHTLDIPLESQAGDFDVIVEATQGVCAQKIEETVNAGAAVTVSGVVEDADGNPIKGKDIITFGTQNISTDKDGKYSFNVVKGTVVGISVETTGYTFTQASWNFGNVDVPVVKNFTAKQSTGTITVVSANDVPINEAKVELDWYYQFSTEDKDGYITYDIDDDVPKNIVDGYVHVFDVSDENGIVKFSYYLPEVEEGKEAPEDFEFALINTKAPEATGYTFAKYVQIKDSTETKDKDAVDMEGQIDDADGAVVDFQSGDGELVAKEDSFKISGTVEGVKTKNPTPGAINNDIPLDENGAYSFYVVKGTVVTVTLNTNVVKGSYEPITIALGTVEEDKVANFAKKVDPVLPVEVKYKVTADGSEEKTVAFDFSVNGEKAVATKKATGASYEFIVVALPGDKIEASASIDGYEVGEFDGYEAYAIKMTTRYVQVQAYEKPIEGATFQVIYTYDDESVVIDLTTSENGLVEYTIPAVAKDVKFVKGTTSISLTDAGIGKDYYGGITYRILNLNDYYGAAPATVTVNYMSAYNKENQSFVASPVSNVNIAPSTVINTFVGESIALKAPSIDNFEFVAWMVDGVVVSEKADYTLVVPADGCDAVALYSAVHYEEPAEGLSMNVLVIGIVILILGILAVAYGIISKKQ